MRGYMLEVLKSIGLTESEGKVYLALLDLGTSTVGPVAKKSGVAYSKVYILLDKLIEKGLATYITKEKTKHFTASEPKKLSEYFEKKQSEIEVRKRQLDLLIPQLVLKKRLSHEEEIAEVYEGYEGLKTIYYDGLDNLSKGDEILVFGASSGKYSDEKKYAGFFKKINSIRISKKIKYRIIYNESLRNSNAAKVWQKSRLTEVRFLLDETPGSVNIQGNRTLIIYWAAGDPKIFTIKSQIVADSFRKYFEVLWSIAKKE